VQCINQQRHRSEGRKGGQYIHFTKVYQKFHTRYAVDYRRQNEISIQMLSDRSVIQTSQKKNTLKSGENFSKID
jgi:hypothetical protein